MRRLFYKITGIDLTDLNKSWCVVLGLFFLVSNVYAQDAYSDSLKQRIPHCTNDTDLVETYCLLGWSLIYMIPDSSISCGEIALKISEKTDMNYGRAISYNLLGQTKAGIGRVDEAMDHFEKALAIKEYDGDSTGMAEILNNIGLVYSHHGNFPKAIETYNKAIGIKKRNSTPYDVATTEINLGYVYYRTGKFSEAMEVYVKTLDEFKKEGDLDGVGTVYIQMALVYEEQELDSMAIIYHKDALEIFRELNDLGSVAGCMSNIAVLLIEEEKLEEAEEMLRESLRLFEEISAVEGIAMIYGNLALVFSEQEKYDEAEEWYRKAIDLDREQGNIRGETATQISMGLMLYEAGSLDKALAYADSALIMTDSLESRVERQDAFELLYMIYEKMGNFEAALKYHKLARILNDSIYNAESNQHITELQTLYETSNKQQQIELLEKDSMLKQAEQRKLYFIIYSFIFGFIIIAFFAFWLFRLYRQKKRANMQLEEKNQEILLKNEEISSQRDEIEAQRDLVLLQKEKIEEINHEITDSIVYAKRIQSALLPGQKKFAGQTFDQFIIFKPKDIVSGDFYWTASVSEWMILAVADCTGHGVPGAFMSMLGISFLNEIVRKKEVTEASEVLNQLRDSVITALKQGDNVGATGEDYEKRIKDGMDISLFAYNIRTKKAQWSGANNPLYLLQRQGRGVSDLSEKETDRHFSATGDFELIEFKPDKMPVGIHERMASFTNVEVDVKAGDRLYLFTDGFADQFGGPQGKKYKYRPFKNDILNTASKPITEQGKILDEILYNWMNPKGSDFVVYEQIDDITIVGLELL